MTTRRPLPFALATQAGELAFAAPQVVAHRVMRMLQAGHNPSARDRREFSLMSAEKLAAFNESWVAMGAECWRMQQQFMFSIWRAWAASWAGVPARWPSLAPGQHAALTLASRGLAPVHRRAVANAKRLGRSRR
jgi:hypothetical protein